MTVLQKEHASQEEIKSALIDAMSRIKNILGEDQVEQWTMALYYLLVLIQHRRPAEERGTGIYSLWNTLQTERR